VSTIDSGHHRPLSRRENLRCQKIRKVGQTGRIREIGWRLISKTLACASLPDASVLIADRGYDGDWFREALSNREIEPCIPGRKNRKEPVEYDTETYRQRNRVERMFGRLKGWRRIAATVIFWL
jgi:transposase